LEQVVQPILLCFRAGTAVLSLLLVLQFSPVLRQQGEGEAAVLEVILLLLLIIMVKHLMAAGLLHGLRRAGVAQALVQVTALPEHVQDSRLLRGVALMIGLPQLLMAAGAVDLEEAHQVLLAVPAPQVQLAEHL
jgi:hypothetical protein